MFLESCHPIVLSDTINPFTAKESIVAGFHPVSAKKLIFPAHSFGLVNDKNTEADVPLFLTFAQVLIEKLVKLVDKAPIEGYFKYPFANFNPCPFAPAS